jgi:hypothetical protein
VLPASNFARASASALLIGSVLVSCIGCRRDEAPEPVPLVESDPANRPSSAPSSSAVGGSEPPATIEKACCDAIVSEAKGAPEPTTSYLKRAAAACYAGIAQHKPKPALLRILRGSIGGARLPTACK